MREITVPRLNGNDDTCTLVEWACADGAAVVDQAPLAVIETAKASSDIHSEGAGVLLAIAAAGTECRVGDVIGYVCTDQDERERLLGGLVDGSGRGGDSGAGNGSGGNPAAGPSVTLTDAARRLSVEHAIPEERLHTLGKRVVREADVRALIARPTGAEALSPRQQAIARVVSRSHASVADAFTAVKVGCDAVLDRLRALNESADTMAGIAEVTVAVLARLRPEFPDFFSLLPDGDRLVRPGAQTHIGVTVDVGTGLFVPVVRDVGARTVREVAEAMMELRVKALRDSFTEDDLRDGQLTVSLNTDDGVLFTVPIVLAPQVCVLSVGAVQTELTVDEDGAVGRSRYLTAGLAYDHRVINGAAAVGFLTAFRAIVEQPTEVPW